MRHFDDDERKLLKKFVDNRTELKTDEKTLRVIDLIQEIAVEKEAIIILDKDTRKSSFVSEKFGSFNIDFEQGNINEAWWKRRNEYDLQFKSILIFSLLDYLEKNNLIYLYSISEDIGTDDTIYEDDTRIYLNGNIDFTMKDESNMYPYKDKDGEPSDIPFLNGNGIENKYLFEKLYYSIFPTPELIEFVNNNFKDEEQLRHENNIFWQKVALGVATTLGVISIIVALISLVPEDLKQQWFGIAKNSKPVKQSLKGSIPDTLISKQKQIITKKPLGRDTLKAKLIPIDSLKR